MVEYPRVLKDHGEDPNISQQKVKGSMTYKRTTYFKLCLLDSKAK